MREKREKCQEIEQEREKRTENIWSVALWFDVGV